MTLAVMARVVVAGVIVAMAAFGVTSVHADVPTEPTGCGLQQVTEPAGFDLLTGEPHGRTYVLNCPFGPVTEHEDLPADMVGRRAILLPVGFLVTCVAALLAIAVSRWTRRPGDIRER